MTGRENRRGRSRRREPQQSNHDVCVVPEEVSAHEGKPLYVLVALWCLKRGMGEPGADSRCLRYQ